MKSAKGSLVQRPRKVNVPRDYWDGMEHLAADRLAAELHHMPAFDPGDAVGPGEGVHGGVEGLGGALLEDREAVHVDTGKPGQSRVGGHAR